MALTAAVGAASMGAGAAGAVFTAVAAAPLAVVVLTEAAGDIVGAARSGARALSAEEAITGAEVFAVDQPRAAQE